MHDAEETKSRRRIPGQHPCPNRRHQLTPVCVALENVAVGYSTGLAFTDAGASVDP